MPPDLSAFASGRMGPQAILSDPRRHLRDVLERIDLIDEFFLEALREVLQL